MKDIRDPVAVGAALLCARAIHVSRYLVGSDERLTCAMTADFYANKLQEVPDYASDLGPIEKYGDPTKLPSTMP